MSFYSLPKLSQPSKLSTDFRPTIPIVNGTKELFGIIQEPFTLVIIDNNQFRHCKRIERKLSSPHGTHTALLFYDLKTSSIADKLNQYTSIDFCQDYLNTFDEQLCCYTFLNCFTDGDSKRLIELSNPVQLNEPDKEQVKEIKSILKSKSAYTFTQVIIGLVLALAADKRNFPYSYIWAVIDPYHPDWSFWTSLYSSYGFTNPELVTETPTGSALTTEMIQVTRNNNFTGKTSLVDTTKITHYHRALLGYVSDQATVVAMKWKHLGSELHDLLALRQEISGALFFAVNKEGKHRILRIGDAKPRLLMWPTAIKSFSTIEGIGLPFKVITTNFITSETLWNLSKAIIDKTGLGSTIIVSERGIYLLQCTLDYQLFLRELQDDPQKRTLLTTLEDVIAKWGTLEEKTIQNMRFETLFDRINSSIAASMQGLYNHAIDSYRNKQRTTLFRLGYCTWDSFEQDGILFTYLFNPVNQSLEYKTTQLV